MPDQETENTNLPALRPERQYAVVSHAVPMLDTARFEHMQRVANLLGCSSRLPDHWKGRNQAEAVANAFVLLNLATNFEAEPLFIAQETYLTPGGQIGYSGKLIAANLERKFGVVLDYEFFGEEDSEEFGVIASGPRPRDGVIVSVKGTVKQWRTRDKQGNVKSNWANQPEDQLIYRATRQWARRYFPAAMLGMYSDDDMDDMIGNMRATMLTSAPAAQGGIIDRIAAANQAAVDHVQQVEAEIGSADQKQNESSGETTTAAKSDASPPAASEGKPAPDEAGPADGRAGSDGDAAGPAAAGSATEPRGEGEGAEGGKGSGKAEKRATGQRKAGKQASSGDAPADGEKTGAKAGDQAGTQDEARQAEQEGGGQSGEPDFMADMTEDQMELYESIKRNLAKVTTFQMWLEFKKVRKADRYDDSMAAWPEPAREHILGMIETARARAGA